MSRFSQLPIVMTLRSVFVELLLLVLVDLRAHALDGAHGVEEVQHLQEGIADSRPAEAILELVALGLLVDVRVLERDLLSDDGYVDRDDGPVDDHVVARRDDLEQVAEGLVVSDGAAVHEVQPVGKRPEPEDGAADGFEATEDAEGLHLLEPRRDLGDKEKAHESLLEQHERVVQEPHVTAGPTLIQINVEPQIPEDAHQLEDDVRDADQHEVFVPRVRRGVVAERAGVAPVLLGCVIETDVFEVVDYFLGVLADLIELVLDRVCFFLEQAADIINNLLRRRRIFIVLSLSLVVFSSLSFQLFLDFLLLLEHFSLDFEFFFACKLLVQLLLEIFDRVADYGFIVDDVSQVRAKLIGNLGGAFHGGLHKYLRH